MPRDASLALRREAEIGCAGAPPGNSHGWSLVRPTAACPWRRSRSWRTSSSRGAGRSRGTVPRASWVLVRGEDDLIPGEAGDAGQRLSVEQHEQAGNPVLDGVAVVVEQAAGQCPPVVLFDLGDQVAAGACGYVQAAGVAAGGGPGHEGARVVAAGCPGGEPGVDVALGAGRQAGAGAVQPADQPGRRPDLMSHVAGLLGGDGVPPGSAAEPPQVMPGSEAADDPPFGGIVDLPGRVLGPPFEVGEAFVPGGQDAAGHEDGAQVAGGAAGQVAVKRAVSGRLAGPADLGEDRPGGRAPGQPVHQGDGVAGGQHVVDRLGVRVKAAVIVGQQAEKVLAAGAAGAQAVMVEALGGPAFGAGLERGRVLAVTRAAQRAGGQPGGDGAGVAAAGAGHPLPAAGAAQRPRRRCVSTRPGRGRSWRSRRGASAVSSSRSAACRRRPGSRAFRGRTACRWRAAGGSSAGIAGCRLPRG